MPYVIKKGVDSGTKWLLTLKEDKIGTVDPLD